MLAKLREREPWPTVEAIAITHLHLDHWGDLDPLGVGEPLRSRRVAAEGDSSGCRPAPRPSCGPILAVLGSEDMFDRAFDVVRVRVAGAVHRRDGLEVTAVPVDHYDIQAFGFRVKGDRVLAYSGDSGPSDALAELARDADLLLSRGDARERRLRRSRCAATSRPRR